MLASVTPRQLLIAALLVWCACVALMWWMACPLAGDEAAYALLARGRGEGWLYRPVGFVAFARLGSALGDSELALRLPSALVACGLIPAVYAVGRTLGPWIGAWAAAVIAGTHTFVLRGPALLNDLPSTMCLLAAIALAICELERARGPSYRLVAVAPLLATAFYLRYGSAPTIAIVVAAALVVWWRVIRARPAPVIVSAALLTALLVPFAIYSLRATGSITGILALASEVAGKRYIGHGLVIYLISNPFLYHGVLVTPVALAGLVGIVRPPVRPVRRRPARFLAIVGLGQFVAIGLVSHANARFIFLAMVLLVVLGVDAIARAISARPGLARRAIRIAAVMIIVAWLGILIAIVPVQRHLARGLAEVVAGGRAIRADAAGRPCTVIARAVPQIMWYSGCASLKPARDLQVIPPAPDGHRVYAASVPRRSVDGAGIAKLVGAEPIVIAPGAWYLKPLR